MESIDCKAFKLALGVPNHTSNIGTYDEVNVLSLTNQRKLSAAKFVIKSCINNNYCMDEVKLD